MLTVDLHTLPQEFSQLQEQLKRIAEQPAPAFTHYTPEYEQLYTLSAKYARTQNFIILGRGGSVTGFRALYEALAHYKTTKQVFVVDTLDPDFLAYVKRKCHPDDSLVIAISKSGSTVDVIENLIAFSEYKKLVITENEQGALGKIATTKALDLVRHPAIGGRFSTGTECALLPAALIYIDIKSVVEGMHAMFHRCSPAVPIEQNPALQLAAALYLAEAEGWTEVYAPIYSKQLAGSAELWTQLMHETVCKAGKGQTFLFMDGPECQHHTNQKFFDGPRRALGLFTTVAQPQQEIQLSVEPHLSHISIKGELSLASLDREKLSTALHHEKRGVEQAADKENIPNATITLDILNAGTIGELTAFWEYVAVYSAWLRAEDPFTQPGVELSKEIAIGERKRQ